MSQEVFPREIEARPPTLTDSILKLIWQQRHISRAEIARRTDSSRSTVSEIVASLLSTDLIGEVGMGPSRGGRPPIMLEFRDDAGVILGVEVGAAHVGVALTNLRGSVLAWEQQPHAVRTDPEGTWALVAELCEKCLTSRRGSKRKLVGIGIALPSPVDTRFPDHLSTVVLPDWHGRSEFGELKSQYGVPIFVDNDANLGALAERWWGAGRGIDDFTYVKLGTGVGSGHVMGGKIYRGATGVAGEIGHIAIDPQGDVCVCGLRGCLGTFVGSQALVKRARILLNDYPQSQLKAGELTIEAIEDAAVTGDPLAKQLAGEAAEYLGIAVAGLLNLLNPAMVILGGGLVRFGNLLLDPLRETVRQRTLVSSVAASEVRMSELGPRAVAMGASTMVLDAALANYSLFPGIRSKQGTASS